eukprot:TCONS_00048859-protein
MFRLLLLVAVVQLACARVFIVDNKKKVAGLRHGSLTKPFETIEACIKKLKNPGDECQIREGRYHEEIKIENLKGTKEMPYVIRGYKDERPLLDGTVVLKNVTKWKQNGNIWSAKIDSTIWQLFFGKTMMTNARWPNAKWSDKTIFDGKRWPTLAEGSRSGLIINKGRSLADTGIDMTGALAILNIGSFETFVAKVENHRAGKNQFNFKDTFGDYHFSHDRSRYFLEDKLELLDAEEEWFFNKTDKMLYMYPPQGQKPYDVELRGKVQSYIFTFSNCEFITLKNMDFFTTAVKAVTPTPRSRTSDLVFDSLKFEFHTYSKRMLQDISLINWMDIDGIYRVGRPETWGKFTFYNNVFRGSDGLALSYWGRNVTLSNNLFEYNDWCAANMVKGGGGLATVKSFSIYDVFERNTFRYNGASVAIRPGKYPTVRLNDISKQCWGVIQNDGAGVQLTRKPQNYSRLEYNWVHDQPKYGLRFDGEPPKIGENGTMSRNVVWKCNGLMAKGDYHTVTQNTVFDKRNDKDDDKQGAGCMLCVLKYVRTNPGVINEHTIVTGNIADVANGGKIPKGKGKVYPLQGLIIEGNRMNMDVKRELMDPDNHDFRPRPASKTAQINAGAYEYSRDSKTYWIPGRQVEKASSPVPVDGSQTVITENRDALMWLNALDCYQHNVFFGTIKGTMRLIDSTENDDNVAYLPYRLTKGRSYRWRVDAVCNGSEVKGDTWTFKAI